jgi:glutaredoxin
LRLTIYSKPGCHLCDDMKSVVKDGIAAHPALSLEEIDISTDPVLLEHYGLEVPVLLIDGKKVAKYRISAMELTKAIASRQSTVDSRES